MHADHADTRHTLNRRLQFQVVNPPEAAALLGLPCLKGSMPHGYRWNLPCAGPEIGTAIGWELGLAFLRLRLAQGAADSAWAMDSAPVELAAIVAAHDRGNGIYGAATSYMDGLLACIGLFVDHALNAPQTLPELRRRLLALDDAGLRRRCLAVLDGEMPPDIFNPDDLGFEVGAGMAQGALK